MADPYSALDAFQQSVLSNNIWRQIAQPVAAAKFDTSTWTPSQSFGVSAGQAFLAAALDAIGQNQASKQMELAVGALPSLYTNPLGAVAPVGIERGPWAALKGASIRDSYLESLQQDQEGRQLQNQILRDVFAANPEMGIRALQRAGLKIDPSLVPAQMASEEAPRATDAGPDFGIPSVEEEYDRIYKEARARGERPQQASIAAREGADYLRKRSKSLFESQLKENQQTIDDIEKLVRQGEEGLEKAGTTGSKVASMYEKAVDVLLPWETPEATRQATGDKLLQVTESLGAAINRIKGSGALSDFESKALFATAMSPTSTRAQNEALLRHYKIGLAQMKEHQSFLNYYLDKTGGNPQQAQQMWELYKTDNPIIVTNEDGEAVLNEDRAPWQTYNFKGAYQNFISGGRSALDSFISDALSRGLTKEQARAEWNAQQGL